MKNTMNDIIIRFGAPRMTGGDRLRQQTLDLKKALQQGKILDYIRTPKPKEYTDILITEFLGLKPETLSPADQKIQRLLNILYQINGKEPPLYTRFPRREHPLIIDLTTIAREDCAAHYISDQHKIEFNQI